MVVSRHRTLCPVMFSGASSSNAGGVFWENEMTGDSNNLLRSSLLVGGGGPFNGLSSTGVVSSSPPPIQCRIVPPHRSSPCDASKMLSIPTPRLRVQKPPPSG